LDEVHSDRLSIKEVLGGVEAVNARFGDAVLAPELIPFGAILGVAVCYYVSTVSASDNEDFTQLVMWKVFLMSFYVAVARF
jgi:hypothetical protein